MAWLKCIHHDKDTALVLSRRNGRSFPVTLAKDIKFLVCRNDLLNVTKSPVSGEWIATDYMAMTSRRG